MWIIMIIIFTKNIEKKLLTLRFKELLCYKTGPDKVVLVWYPPWKKYEIQK